MKKISKKAFLFVSVFLLSLVLIACGGSNTLIIGQGDWDSDAFHGQVAKYIIENGYDTQVEIQAADTPILISSLISGQIDATLELWTDNIPTYRDDIANGRYQELTVNMAGNPQGLYIPRYLQEEYPNLTHVRDLLDPEHVALFTNPEYTKSVIYGGPTGWEVTQFFATKMEAYALDEVYEFVPIEVNAMLSATLVDAYRNEEPWVGYNWEPTWLLGMYDMVLLEDDPYNPEDFAEGIGAFPEVDTTVGARNGLEDDFPEIYAFLSNYEFTSARTSDMLAYIQENDARFEDAAIYFLTNYEDVWRPWVSTEAYEKIVASLA